MEKVSFLVLMLMLMLMHMLMFMLMLTLMSKCESALRRLNLGFLSHFVCSGQNAIIFSHEGLVYLIHVLLIRLFTRFI